MDDAAFDDDDYSRKLTELDHLLNDDDIAPQPSRLWSLLAELTHHDRSAEARRGGNAGAG